MILSYIQCITIRIEYYYCNLKIILHIALMSDVPTLSSRSQHYFLVLSDMRHEIKKFVINADLPLPYIIKHALIHLLAQISSTTHIISYHNVTITFPTHLFSYFALGKLLDIVGTGGDGADTINISTASVILSGK